MRSLRSCNLASEIVGVMKSHCSQSHHNEGGADGRDIPLQITATRLNSSLCVVSDREQSWVSLGTSFTTAKSINPFDLGILTAKMESVKICLNQER